MKRANDWRNGDSQPGSDGQLQGMEQRSVSDYSRKHAVAVDEISLLYIWRVLAQSKWAVIAVVLVCTLVSTVYALMATPIYRAGIQVAPVSEKDSNSRFAAQLGNLGGLATLTGINVDQGSKKNESIATLKSRKFTEQFIKDEKLLPVLFHDQWDAENQRWDETDPEDVPTLEDAWELFDKEVRKISEDSKTSLVVLSIEWEDPHEAARWANELVHRANIMLRKKAVTESENAIGYLREELKQTSVVELQQVVNQLVESEMKEIILANITKEYAFRVIDPAVVPEEAFKPVKAVVIAVGVVLGGLLGIIMALYIDFLNSQRNLLRGDESSQ